MASKGITTNAPAHSTAWIIQTWASFIVSTSAMTIGILYTPADAWVKGYLGMGLLFSVGSAISVAKTTRDIHESKQILSRIDEAKIERILSQHDPFKN